MSFYPITLVDGITANGDNDAPPLSGRYALAFYGDLGAATVQFVFTPEDGSGTPQESGVTTDWEFSGTLPGVESFEFPYDLDFIIRVSDADASTNFGIAAYPMRNI